MDPLNLSPAQIVKVEAYPLARARKRRELQTAVAMRERLGLPAAGALADGIEARKGRVV